MYSIALYKIKLVNLDYNHIFARLKEKIMIKKVLFTLAIFGMTVSAQAQLSFDQDTARLTMKDGVAHKATIKVSNTSDHDISYRWSLINSTLNDNDDGDGDNSNNWALQFCECVTCYTNDFAGLPTNAQCPDPLSNVAGANSVDFYLTMDPNGQPLVAGEWIIKVENLTDNITDTLVYYCEVAPLSVKSVNYNAEVTSYPNPANNELVVNYELTNVSTPVLNVYSIVGVKIGTYELNSTQGRLEVSTSQLENGMYFYSIEEKGQRVFTQRFNVVH